MSGEKPVPTPDTAKIGATPGPLVKEQPKPPVLSTELKPFDANLAAADDKLGGSSSPRTSEVVEHLEAGGENSSATLKQLATEEPLGPSPEGEASELTVDAQTIETQKKKGIRGRWRDWRDNRRTTADSRTIDTNASGTQPEKLKHEAQGTPSLSDTTSDEVIAAVEAFTKPQRSTPKIPEALPVVVNEEATAQVETLVSQPELVPVNEEPLDVSLATPVKKDIKLTIAGVRGAEDTDVTRQHAAHEAQRMKNLRKSNWRAERRAARDLKRGSALQRPGSSEPKVQDDTIVVQQEFAATTKAGRMRHGTERFLKKAGSKIVKGALYAKENPSEAARKTKEYAKYGAITVKDTAVDTAKEFASHPEVFIRRVWESTLIDRSVAAKDTRVALQLGRTLNLESVSPKMRDLIQEAAKEDIKAQKAEYGKIRRGAHKIGLKPGEAIRAASAQRNELDLAEQRVAEKIRLAYTTPEDKQSDELKAFIADEHNHNLLTAMEAEITGQIAQHDAQLDRLTAQRDLDGLTDAGQSMAPEDQQAFIKDVFAPIIQDELTALVQGKELNKVEAEIKLNNLLLDNKISLSYATNLRTIAKEVAADIAQTDNHVAGVEGIDAILDYLEETSTLSVDVTKVTDESVAKAREYGAKVTDKAIEAFMNTKGATDALVEDEALARVAMLNERRVKTAVITGAGTIGYGVALATGRSVARGLTGGLAFGSAAITSKRVGREFKATLASDRTKAARGEDISGGNKKIVEAAMVPIKETNDQLSAILTGLEGSAQDILPQDMVQDALVAIARVDGRNDAGAKAGYDLWMPEKQGNQHQELRDMDSVRAKIMGGLRSKASIDDLRVFAEEIGADVNPDANIEGYLQGIRSTLRAAVEDNVTIGREYGEKVATALAGEGTVYVDTSVEASENAAKWKRLGMQAFAATAVMAGAEASFEWMHALKSEINGPQTLGGEKTAAMRNVDYATELPTKPDPNVTPVNPDTWNIHATHGAEISGEPKGTEISNNFRTRLIKEGDSVKIRLKQDALDEAGKKNAVFEFEVNGHDPIVLAPTGKAPDGSPVFDFDPKGTDPIKLADGSTMQPQEVIKLVFGENEGKELADLSEEKGLTFHQVKGQTYQETEDLTTQEPKLFARVDHVWSGERTVAKDGTVTIHQVGALPGGGELAKAFDASSGAKVGDIQIPGAKIEGGALVNAENHTSVLIPKEQWGHYESALQGMHFEDSNGKKMEAYIAPALDGKSIDVVTVQGQPVIQHATIDPSNPAKLTWASINAKEAIDSENHTVTFKEIKPQPVPLKDVPSVTLPTTDQDGSFTPTNPPNSHEFLFDGYKINSNGELAQATPNATDIIIPKKQLQLDINALNSIKIPEGSHYKLNSITKQWALVDENGVTLADLKASEDGVTITNAIPGGTITVENNVPTFTGKVEGGQLDFSGKNAPEDGDLSNEMSKSKHPKIDDRTHPGNAQGGSTTAAEQVWKENSTEIDHTKYYTGSHEQDMGTQVIKKGDHKILRLRFGQPGGAVEDGKSITHFAFQIKDKGHVETILVEAAKGKLELDPNSTDTVNLVGGKTMTQRELFTLIADKKTFEGLDASHDDLTVGQEHSLIHADTVSSAIVTPKDGKITVEYVASVVGDGHMAKDAISGVKTETGLIAGATRIEANHVTFDAGVDGKLPNGALVDVEVLSQLKVHDANGTTDVPVHFVYGHDGWGVFRDDTGVNIADGARVVNNQLILDAIHGKVSADGTTLVLDASAMKTDVALKLPSTLPKIDALHQGVKRITINDHHFDFSGVPVDAQGGLPIPSPSDPTAFIVDRPTLNRNIDVLSHMVVHDGSGKEIKVEYVLNTATGNFAVVDSKGVTLTEIGIDPTGKVTYDSAYGTLTSDNNILTFKQSSLAQPTSSSIPTGIANPEITVVSPRAVEVITPTGPQLTFSGVTIDHTSGDLIDPTQTPPVRVYNQASLNTILGNLKLPADMKNIEFHHNLDGSWDIIQGEQKIKGVTIANDGSLQQGGKAINLGEKGGQLTVEAPGAGPETGGKPLPESSSPYGKTIVLPKGLVDKGTQGIFDSSGTKIYASLGVMQRDEKLLSGVTWPLQMQGNNIEFILDPTTHTWSAQNMANNQVIFSTVAFNPDLNSVNTTSEITYPHGGQLKYDVVNKHYFFVQDLKTNASFRVTPMEEVALGGGILGAATGAVTGAVSARRGSRIKDALVLGGLEAALGATVGIGALGLLGIGMVSSGAVGGGTAAGVGGLRTILRIRRRNRANRLRDQLLEPISSEGVFPNISSSPIKRERFILPTGASEQFEQAKSYLTSEKSLTDLPDANQVSLVQVAGAFSEGALESPPTEELETVLRSVTQDEGIIIRLKPAVRFLLTQLNTKDSNIGITTHGMGILVNLLENGPGFQLRGFNKEARNRIVAAITNFRLSDLETHAAIPELILPYLARYTLPEPPSTEPQGNPGPVAGGPPDLPRAGGVDEDDL